MEGRVEDAHLWNLGQQRTDGIHALDVGGVVQRGQVIACGKGFHHLWGENDTLVELFAAVHHAMTDGIQFVKALQHGILALGQYLEDPLNPSRMLGDGAFHLVFLAI